MADRQQIATQTAEALRSFADRVTRLPGVIGFDGFVDSIISVVDTRHSTDEFDAVKTIAQFGEKISNAAGKSSNYELVIKQTKLGGNGPILANALAGMGMPITYIGAVGYPELHPAFEDFAKKADVFSISEPGYTDALEFNDGKLLLGKSQQMTTKINWQQIIKVVGAEKINQVFNESHLIGMVNWTMLPEMGQIWQHLIDEVLPNVSKTESDKRKIIFIDLADPEKRSRDDLRNALELCRNFNPFADVVVGLNLKEAIQVAAVFDVDTTSQPEKAIRQIANDIRSKLNISTVVVHSLKEAAASTVDGDNVVTSDIFSGPYFKTPKLSTGGGDNFNAGFCIGTLAGLPLAGALCTANATSGYYVSHAVSPSLTQLADFCDNLPAPINE